MVQIACPDAARWEALLADSSSPVETNELEAHLSSCTRCQTLIDELAVGSSGWLRDAGRLAGATDPDPALTRTLHRLHDTPLDDDHAVPPIPLDFLTPSNLPGILGTLGRYQVLTVLGRGAMGIVLKALDPDLLRPVAIKVLAPYLATSGTGRQRFIREGRAAAAVSHDHVVTIHGIEPAGLPYIVMEYVTGVSLQARLDRDGPLPSHEIARIGLQAAQGLAAAHAVGLIHRDVKPANILLENGVERVKLTDFGLAQAADDARLTQSGVAAGTPLYMSPEQARGERVDSRSDLFSLGSVLYALATGFPPFRAGSTMGVLNRITNDPPRPIRDTIPDFPPALEAIIMQLLERDPQKRFQLGADVSFRLTAFLAGPSATAASAADADEEPETEESGPTKWWVTALCLLAAAAMVAIVLTFRTPKGTLIVEVDDPAIKVALDGEELTITGAGPQEVRLKAGSYELIATKDGKQVKQEIVTITKGGKQVVKVTVEPAPSPPAKPAITVAFEGYVAPMLHERLKAVFPDGDINRMNLVRVAWQDAQPDAPIRTFDGVVPQTHPSYSELRRLAIEGGKDSLAPERVRDVIESAYYLADKILKDTAISEALNRGRRSATGSKGTAKLPFSKGNGGPARTSDNPEQRQMKLIDDFQALVGRLIKTEAGRVLLTTGPGADLDKLMAGLSAEETIRAKRLIVLRDQFGVLVPKAQQALDRWEKAGLEHQNREIRYTAGIISENEFEAARLEVKQSERALRTLEDAMSGILADMTKLANELHAPAADAPEPDPFEAAYKKVMAEYEALVVRLARHPVGRVIVVVDQNWNLESLKDRGLEAQGREMAVKLLNLRDEIRIQARNGDEAVRNMFNTRLSSKDGPPASKADAAEFIRKYQQEVKLRTETIRGLLDDLKKLADVIDPTPAKEYPDPVPVDPKARLQSLRDQLRIFEKEEKEVADLTARVDKEVKELNKLVSDLPKAAPGPAADALKDKVDSARKAVDKVKSDLAWMKGNLARVGPKTELLKQIDQLQKLVEAKKADQ